jgi:Protein of unknown function (DUF1623)
MQLINFTVGIINEQRYTCKEIYLLYLRYFDVIDAVMCVNGDCLAVCRSSVDELGWPLCFKRFVTNNRNSIIRIIDQHHDIELLTNRMYEIVEVLNKIIISL